MEKSCVSNVVCFAFVPSMQQFNQGSFYQSKIDPLALQRFLGTRFPQYASP